VGLGALRRLTKLWLTHNALRALPPDFGDMPALEWLWLNDNLFKTARAYTQPTHRCSAQRQCLRRAAMRLFGAPTPPSLRCERGLVLAGEVWRPSAFALTSLKGPPSAQAPREALRLASLKKLWMNLNPMTELPLAPAPLQQLEWLCAALPARPALELVWPVVKACRAWKLGLR
jgi:Leucine-rich repeat (LRR) protein